MSNETSKSVNITGFGGVGLGVFWFAWTKFGFWWGLCYGIFWPTWVGFRLAEYLLG